MLWFILIVIVRPLSVTIWPSAYAVLLNTVLIVCAPFPFGVWGRMWNSIVSVPDHCLFTYLHNPTPRHQGGQYANYNCLGANKNKKCITFS